MKKTKTYARYADFLAFMGLLVYGRLGLKLLLVHQVGGAFAVLGILIVWEILCVFALRKQHRA
ncbi:hypothetical protein [Spirosoma aerolatum]|uniref:hypothetical protein n=1 Tax=Spirosoma aerolatum TaxID=1211326 RepID=UPI0009AC1268|nr:hypothetical protein [Spirosoma aerolatum]